MNFEYWLVKFRADNPHHKLDNISLKIGWEAALKNQLQSIEAAPKDGEPILGLNSDGDYVVAYWSNRDYWCAQGFYLSEIDGQTVGYDLELTHFMLLPNNI